MHRTLQLVTETHLIRRGVAQRRVIDREISNARWQSQPVRRLVGLVVGSDLLDVHRWRKCVEREMMRIDDADAARAHEPQLAIRGFCDDRVEGARKPLAAHSVGTIEHRHLDRLLWMGGPGFQLGPANAHQATGQIQPDRLGVILHHPVNRIARHSVLAGERENVTVFDAAQPPLSRDPECTVAVEVETADPALSQPFGACIRCAELTILEIRDATVSKSKPQTTLHSIMQESTRRLSAPEPGPGDAFDHTLLEQMEKPLLMTHPDVPCTVVGKRKDDSVRYGCYGNKPVGLKKGNPAWRSDPHSPTSVLKQGVRLIRQPTVGDLTNRGPRVTLPPRSESADRGTTAHTTEASIAIIRDLAFIPPIQPIRGAEPKTAILRGQNRKHPCARETLQVRKRWDGEVAKPVQTSHSCHPNIAFPILKKRGNGPA